VYCPALIAPARRTQDLLAQPHQVCFELPHHRRRGEIPREWLVAVQQVLGMRFNKDVNGIEQSLEIALLYKGRPR